MRKQELKLTSNLRFLSECAVEVDDLLSKKNNHDQVRQCEQIKYCAVYAFSGRGPAVSIAFGNKLTLRAALSVDLNGKEYQENH